MAYEPGSVVRWLAEHCTRLGGMEGRLTRALGRGLLRHRDHRVRTNGKGRPARTELHGSGGASPLGGYHLSAGLVRTNHPSEPILAYLGERVPMAGRGGTCDPLAGSEGDPDQLRLPYDDLVVADGPSALGRDDCSPAESACWQTSPGLENLLRSAGHRDSYEASNRIRRSFSSLAEALSAEPAAIVATAGAQTAEILSATQAFYCEMLSEPLRQRRVIANSDDVSTFLTTLIGYRSLEALVALFLDGNNRLICHQIIAEGDVSSAPFHNRSILLRALERGATSVILAHNHPSGDPNPSVADLRVTGRLMEAARTLDLHLLDHIIVTSSGMTSMRELNLLH